MGFLLAILETSARMGFQHTVLGAEVAVAEATVADDTLSGFLALLEIATWLTGSHDVCVVDYVVVMVEVERRGWSSECWESQV